MPMPEMFWPMGALALLTLAVLGLIPVRRFSAIAKKQVKGADFKFGESAAVPGYVSLPNRNYMNLLEFPVLFYVVGLMFVTASRTTPLALEIAWGFVGLRILHSFIHLTYNNVVHRLTVFGVSNFVLAGLWGVFFLGL